MVFASPSYFELQVRWLRACTPVTYLSKLLGMPALAAFLQLELFWALVFIFFLPAFINARGKS
ncbi:hypothetical protein PZBJ_10065 [Pantoea endophytica]|uniref:Uncharacterized protein n=1 Tax=Pantoea endophytica TaxID=92488 RepID=A0ABX4SSU1_9GAMM|nr:hypothetical protein PZBJ_10065 [Pantoea endophytica]